MHKTEAGEKRKALKAEALQKARDAKTREKARKLEGKTDELKAEAESLKRAARLEDLSVWIMKKTKTTKKGTKTYQYWMANWRESGKVRNVHLGSCGKMDEETARQKARAIKAKALGI